MPISRKNINDTSEIKVSINSNLNFTMWVFALGLANDHNIYKKYEKIAKHITLSILIWEIILFNQISKGDQNENWIQSCEQHAVPK